MLERAYSIHRHNGYGNSKISDVNIQDIFFMNKQMKELKGGWQHEAIGNIVGVNNVKITYARLESEYIKLIEESINDPNKIIVFATKKGGNNTKYDLSGLHAYHIVGYDKVKGTVTISNPWHNNKVREIPINDWLNYVYDFKIIELK